MAVTIKHTNGRADETPTPSGTTGYLLYGPPPSGNPNHKGIYLLQSSGTYRFTGDEIWTPGVASPSAWTFA